MNNKLIDLVYKELFAFFEPEWSRFSTPDIIDITVATLTYGTRNKYSKEFTQKGLAHTMLYTAITKWRKNKIYESKYEKEYVLYMLIIETIAYAAYEIGYPNQFISQNEWSRFISVTICEGNSTGFWENILMKWITCFFTEEDVDNLNDTLAFYHEEL